MLKVKLLFLHRQSTEGADKGWTEDIQHNNT